MPYIWFVVGLDKLPFLSLGSSDAAIVAHTDALQGMVLRWVEAYFLGLFVVEFLVLLHAVYGFFVIPRLIRCCPMLEWAHTDARQESSALELDP